MAGNLGYSDTPLIPGTQWHVHDGDRPQPPIVTPGTFSEGATPPSDAVVLFDGKSLDNWEGGSWKVENGYVEVVPGTGTLRTRKEFGDCQLHLEFTAPTVVKGDGQGRGNSGVFILGLYEIQVLDNYDNPTYPDGTVGGIYGQYPPLANAIRKPGEWNAYDIIWEGPRWEGEKLVKPGYLTVILNGVLLHNRKEVQGPTQHRVTAEYRPHPTEGPLELQDHGDLVRFRNIWYRPLKGYDGAASL
ncbi:MAG TPA: DUF1080 domain-containing protein [Fimbriimonas sp.]